MLPTTTIGSFPQTLDVKKNRTRYKKGEINKDEYDKKIYLNEINTLPGFTEISMFPKLIMNKGINYKDIISKLIDNALL